MLKGSPVPALAAVVILTSTWDWRVPGPGGCGAMAATIMEASVSFLFGMLGFGVVRWVVEVFDC